MSLVIVCGETQNFKFNPNNYFVPKGNLSCLHGSQVEAIAAKALLLRLS